MHRREITLRVLSLLVVAACAHAPPREVDCATAAWKPLAEPSEIVPIASAHLGDWIAAIAIPDHPDLLVLLETKPGMTLGESPLRDDLRRLWAVGLFADLRVTVAMASDGAHVEIVGVPHAGIASVTGVEVARLARLRELAGAAYEPARVHRIAAAIERNYVADGFVDARVAVRRSAGPGAVALCVAANPGPQVRVTAIRLPGRSSLAEATLLTDHLHVGDVFDANALELAVDRVQYEYRDRGFMLTKVGPARVIRHGGAAEIEIPIVEGGPVTVSKVTLGEGLVMPAAALAHGEVYDGARADALLHALEAQVGKHDSVRMSFTVDPVAHQVAIAFTVEPR